VAKHPVSTSVSSQPTPVPSAAPVSVPAGPTVAWSPCKSGQGPAGDQCATLTVPLDYGHPQGQRIAVAVARHPATTGPKYGSLLINPGGPGASGIDILQGADIFFSPSILKHFDVVGFDPRGVARSTPVHCSTGPQLDSFFHLDPAPTTDAGFQAMVDADRQFVQGCVAKSGPLLPYLGTDNVARDMDQLRQALGDPKLTFMGFSYGTFIGATYADLFPNNVRAMVLDGAIDPAQDAISTNIGQAAAFNQELNAFFANCVADLTCVWRPAGDLRQAFDSLMAQIRAHPLVVGTRSVGPGEAFLGVADGLYDRQSWPDLAAALSRASQGDGSVLLEFSDLYTKRRPNGTYDNVLEANEAVTCADNAWPTDPNAVRQYSAQAAAQAPEFGVPDLYSGVVCSLWPLRPARAPHPITAPGSPPIVVVGSTGDPATPYQASQALAKELSRGVLLTRVGGGHTGYPFSACIKSKVDAYLLNLVVPPNGTSCPTP
jgi:pimeloyl-ACP methyl ester carboxylesterase